MAILIHFTSSWHNLINRFRHTVYTPIPSWMWCSWNAPDYDPDIDGQPDPVIDLQSLIGKSVIEDIAPNTANSEQNTALSTDTNRPQSQPSSALDDIDHPRYQGDTHSRAEHPSDYRPQLEDIPELETDEENWEEGQFKDADLIDHHNTTEESDRIHHEYSAHFEKVHTTAHQGSNIRFLNQNTTTPTHDQNNIRGIKIQRYISLPHHLRKIYIHGMVTVMEEPSVWSCIAIGCTERKPDH